MNFYNAEKQFNENFRIFADPNTEPEKYNLYAGLANLAKGLEDMQAQIENLQVHLRTIEQRLK